MSRFDRTTKTIHAEWWEEGESVTLQELTWGAQKAILSEIMGDTKITPGMSPELDINAATRMQEMQMVEMVAGWTFTNGSGEPVPVDLEHLRQLAPKDAEFILAEMDGMNPRQDESFLGGRGDGVPDGAGETAD